MYVRGVLHRDNQRQLVLSGNKTVRSCGVKQRRFFRGNHMFEPAQLVCSTLAAGELRPLRVLCHVISISLV